MPSTQSAFNNTVAICESFLKYPRRNCDAQGEFMCVSTCACACACGERQNERMYTYVSGLDMSLGIVHRKWIFFIHRKGLC